MFQVKIQDVDHLCEWLGEAWEQITQDEVDRVIKAFREIVMACIDADGKRFDYSIETVFVNVFIC